MENIIIIGAGPAGISAALYAARANLDPLVIYHGKGALEKAEKIENYYGLERSLTGRELYERGIEQAKALGVRLLEAQVLGMQYTGSFHAETTAGAFKARSVILATGSRRNTPDIPGVEEFEGRGISYCAVCDAFFYRGKHVAVLGNSDFALHEAEALHGVAASVTICTDGVEPAFSREHEIPVNTMKIQSIEGEDMISGIRMDADSETGEIRSQEAESKDFLPADGVFVAMGVAGSTEIARQMGAMLNEKGQIQVDETMAASIDGLFAAGDCTGGLLQVSKAVYEGAQAAMSAIKFVRKSRNGS